MKTILSNSTSELIIKNSKFITLLIKIDDNSNINNILEEVKTKYPKATHYCYAYITENYKKSSDDGEPGGTAGMPILNVLEKEEIINVLAIVVRYFGGIKLGTGGLVRAYSKAVREALINNKTINLVPGAKIKISFSYEEQRNIDYLLKNYEILNKEFLEKINYIVLIPIEELKNLNDYTFVIIEKIYVKK